MPDLGTSIMFRTVFFGVSTAMNPVFGSQDSNLVTSVNFFGGLQYEKLKFGISHDFMTSNMNQSGGIYELSLTYQFDLGVKCFGCPNYESKSQEILRSRVYYDPKVYPKAFELDTEKKG